MIRETTFKLPLQTDEQLKAFLDRAWGVQLPDVRVCEHHSTPFQAAAEAYFARTPISVWKGTRGFGGKTFTLAVLALTEAVTLAADVNILGGAGHQSKMVKEAIDALWRHPSAPRQMLDGEPLVTETRFRNGATMRALLASQTSVRGPHPQRLRLDEIDEMNIEIFDAALGQTMARRGVKAQTVCSSTEQYPNKTMRAVLDRAAERNWPVHEWCYRETVQPNGWLDPEEIPRKRAEVSEEMWNREYEGIRPTEGALAINAEAVKGMFRRNLGVFVDVGQLITVEAFMPGFQYAHGSDWARKQDFTVHVTARGKLHEHIRRWVAFQRVQRTSWPAMVSLLDERRRMYPGPAQHDGTGVGDVVDGYLREPAESILMVGRERANLISNYVSAIENGRYEAPYIDSAFREHARCTWADLYGAGHAPDTIVAGALAHAAYEDGSRYILPSSITVPNDPAPEWETSLSGSWSDSPWA